MNENQLLREALRLIWDFNRYFTSSNGIDVPDRISVPRDEWRKVRDAVCAALSHPAQSEGGEAHRCHVYNVTKTGSLCEWEPTAQAFAIPDGKHALYTAPPASQEQAQQPAACDGGTCGVGGYCNECPQAQSEFASEEVQRFVIEVEKLLCQKLGRKWSPSGMSIQTLVDELATKPQSQAQELPEPHAIVTSKLGNLCSFHSSEARKGDAIFTADQMLDYARAALAAKQQRNPQ